MSETLTDSDVGILLSGVTGVPSIGRCHFSRSISCCCLRPTSHLFISVATAATATAKSQGRHIPCRHSHRRSPMKAHPQGTGEREREREQERGERKQKNKQEQIPPAPTFVFCRRHRPVKVHPSVQQHGGDEERETERWSVGRL